MSKYKVVVYAICKNESQFVNRWVDSMQEADEIYVLDTGSTDDTVKLLKKRKVKVKRKIIKPWRFDVARNISLEMVPKDADICVCTDLDELFNKGWRKNLEDNWSNNTTKLRYIYNWSLDDNNKPIVSFYYEKIHSRNNYKWINPVHEILSCNNKEFINTTDSIILNHYPDKSKSRSSYLPLLELSIKEDPLNDRNMHYLGREYMYYGKWNECIDTLINHLNLSTATWIDERSASMRYIARSYINLNRYDEAKMWLNKAHLEAPHLRDPLVELALLNYQLKEYDKAIYNSLKALEITKHEMTYINETFSWDYTLYDLLSLSYYYNNDINNSIIYSDLALSMDPSNKRLIENNMLIKTKKEA